MSKQDTALIERQKRARRIVRNPGQYKVCGGCESIVAAKVHICPNCHSYRFDSDRDFVVAQARTLSSREQKSVVSNDLI